MQNEWYYLSAGQQCGPVPLARIRELIAAGLLTGRDEVWQTGTPAWRPLQVMPEFRDLCFCTSVAPASVASRLTAPPAAGPAPEAGCTGRMPGVYAHRPPAPWWWAVTIPLFLVFTTAAGLLGYLFLGSNVHGGDTFATLCSLGWVVFLLVTLLGMIYRYFWRFAFEIDPSNRTVTVGQGPVWPLFESHYSITAFNAVVLTTQVRRWSRGGSDFVYSLELDGAVGRVRLARKWDPEAIRELAEDVGRFLRLDVIDAIENPPIVRKAETLGQTLRQAARRSEPAAPRCTILLPLPPDVAGMDYELLGDRAVFRFHAAYGCLAVWLLFAAAALALVGVIAVQSGHPLVIAMWCGLVGLPLLMTFALAAPTQTTVEADCQTIRITTTALGIPTRQEVATHQVTEVRRTYKAIDLKARGRRLSFGCRSLTEKQVEWIRSVLIQIVTAQPGSAFTVVRTPFPTDLPWALDQ